MTGLYYTPPSDEAFEEMRSECMAQWATHDNSYGYVDEKQERVEHIKNIQDNFMYMFAMFDIFGQKAIVGKLSKETKEALRVRMIDGGNNDLHLSLIGL